MVRVVGSTVSGVGRWVLVGCMFREAIGRTGACDSVAIGDLKVEQAITEVCTVWQMEGRDSREGKAGHGPNGLYCVLSRILAW